MAAGDECLAFLTNAGKVRVPIELGIGIRSICS
jgi:hypothetical protein